MGIFAPRSAYPEKAHALRNGLLAGGSVILLAGTLIFWIPQGLSNFALTIPIYLNGWIVPSGVSIDPITGCVVYLPAFRSCFWSHRRGEELDGIETTQ